MTGQHHYLVFSLDEHRYALALGSVERVVRMVEITPLPTAPSGVLGMVNLQGTIIPVFSLREVFGLPESEIRLSDQLVITQISQRVVALAVDATMGVIACAARELVATEDFYLPLHGVEGVIVDADGLVVISDLVRLLHLDEEFAAAVAAAADLAEVHPS